MPAINIYVTEEEYLSLVEIGKNQNKSTNEIAQHAIKKYLLKEVKLQ
jgi:hypothetical protein